MDRDETPPRKSATEDGLATADQTAPPSASSTGGGPDRPRSFFAQVVRRAAVISAIVLVCGVLLGQSKLLARFEHWLQDWRFTFVGNQLDSAHPGVTLVLIREETLLGRASYSPIDRSLLAQTLRTIDGFEPRVVGFDFIYDKPTADDEDFLEAIASADAPIVLAAFEDRSEDGSLSIPEQRAFQDAFLERAGRPYGFVNVATDFDGVVRRRARAGDSTQSFADEIADAAGAPPSEGSRRIDWLRPPALGGQTFSTLYVEELLDLADAPDMLSPVLADRVIVVGAGLRVMTDYHMTPLDRADGDETLGVEIVAQMIAQRLDDREIYEPGPLETFFAAAVVAFLSALGVLWFHGRLIMDTVIGLGVLFALDLALFAVLHIAAPLGVMAAAFGFAALLSDVSVRRWPLTETSAT